MTDTASDNRSPGRFGDCAAKALSASLYGMRLATAVSLALFIAFYLQLDSPSWAGTSAAIVCQPIVGSSLLKGVFRMIGTAVGAVAAVLLTAVFPQDRAGFLFAHAGMGVSLLLRVDAVAQLRGLRSHARRLDAHHHRQHIDTRA